MYIELLENIFWMEFGLTGVISGIMGDIWNYMIKTVGCIKKLMMKVNYIILIIFGIGGWF